MPSGPRLRGPDGFPPGGVVGLLVDVLGFAIMRQRPDAFWTAAWTKWSITPGWMVTEYARLLDEAIVVLSN